MNVRELSGLKGSEADEVAAELERWVSSKTPETVHAGDLDQLIQDLKMAGRGEIPGKSWYLRRVYLAVSEPRTNGGNQSEAEALVEVKNESDFTWVTWWQKRADNRLGDESRFGRTARELLFCVIQKALNSGLDGLNFDLAAEAELKEEGITPYRFHHRTELIPLVEARGRKTREFLEGRAASGDTGAVEILAELEKSASGTRLAGVSPASIPIQSPFSPFLAEPVKGSGARLAQSAPKARREARAPHKVSNESAGARLTGVNLEHFRKCLSPQQEKMIAGLFRKNGTGLSVVQSPYFLADIDPSEGGGVLTDRELTRFLGVPRRQLNRFKEALFKVFSEDQDRKRQRYERGWEELLRLKSFRKFMAEYRRKRARAVRWAWERVADIHESPEKIAEHSFESFAYSQGFKSIPGFGDEAMFSPLVYVSNESYLEIAEAKSLMAQEEYTFRSPESFKERWLLAPELDGPGKYFFPACLAAESIGNGWIFNAGCVFHEILEEGFVLHNVEDLTIRSARLHRDLAVIEEELKFSALLGRDIFEQSLSNRRKELDRVKRYTGRRGFQAAEYVTRLEALLDKADFEMYKMLGIARWQKAAGGARLSQNSSKARPNAGAGMADRMQVLAKIPESLRELFRAQASYLTLDGLRWALDLDHIVLSEPEVLSLFAEITGQVPVKPAGALSLVSETSSTLATERVLDACRYLIDHWAGIESSLEETRLFTKRQIADLKQSAGEIIDRRAVFIADSSPVHFGTKMTANGPEIWGRPDYVLGVSPIELSSATAHELTHASGWNRIIDAEVRRLWPFIMSNYGLDRINEVLCDAIVRYMFLVCRNEVEAETVEHAVRLQAGVAPVRDYFDKLIAVEKDPNIRDAYEWSRIIIGRDDRVHYPQLVDELLRHHPITISTEARAALFFAYLFRTSKDPVKTLLAKRETGVWEETIRWFTKYYFENDRRYTAEQTSQEVTRHVVPGELPPVRISGARLAGTKDPRLAPTPENVIPMSREASKSDQASVDSSSGDGELGMTTTDVGARLATAAQAEIVRKEGFAWFDEGLVESVLSEFGLPGQAHDGALPVQDLKLSREGRLLLAEMLNADIGTLRPDDEARIDATDIDENAEVILFEDQRRRWSLGILFYHGNEMSYFDFSDIYRDPRTDLNEIQWSFRRIPQNPACSDELLSYLSRKGKPLREFFALVKTSNVNTLNFVESRKDARLLEAEQYILFNIYKAAPGRLERGVEGLRRLEITPVYFDPADNFSRDWQQVLIEFRRDRPELFKNKKIAILGTGTGIDSFYFPEMSLAIEKSRGGKFLTAFNILFGQRTRQIPPEADIRVLLGDRVPEDASFDLGLMNIPGINMDQSTSRAVIAESYGIPLDEFRELFASIERGLARNPGSSFILRLSFDHHKTRLSNVGYEFDFIQAYPKLRFERVGEDFYIVSNNKSESSEGARLVEGGREVPILRNMIFGWHFGPVLSRPEAVLAGRVFNEALERELRDRRISTPLRPAAFEMATNVMMHAPGGTVRVFLEEREGEPVLRIVAEDRGEGMENPDELFRVSCAQHREINERMKKGLPWEDLRKSLGFMHIIAVPDAAIVETRGKVWERRGENVENYRLEITGESGIEKGTRVTLIGRLRSWGTGGARLTRENRALKHLLGRPHFERFCYETTKAYARPTAIRFAVSSGGIPFVFQSTSVGGRLAVAAVAPVPMPVFETADFNLRLSQLRQKRSPDSAVDSRVDSLKTQMALWKQNYRSVSPLGSSRSRVIEIPVGNLESAGRDALRAQVTLLVSQAAEMRRAHGKSAPLVHLTGLSKYEFDARDVLKMLNAETYMNVGEADSKESLVFRCIERDPSETEIQELPPNVVPVSVRPLDPSNVPNLFDIVGRIESFAPAFEKVFSEDVIRFADLRPDDLDPDAVARYLGRCPSLDAERRTGVELYKLFTRQMWGKSFSDLAYDWLSMKVRLNELLTLARTCMQSTGRSA